ncbi:hypothetical protein NEIELOOT_02447 [Neisseria elongata subsp. glycolytica ATCC 29315]|uniref:Uncharacterized protein n=1 Tax=Neisseria elongata subsp. glycolytica ATCC 29315 TaxID=546263 RepID=D4DTP1_NEIEG|nr:hypothetical protein NEIELOOT_02447 [Neisseria elongata subsp. glycolytica ATCC 29315]
MLAKSKYAEAKSIYLDGLNEWIQKRDEYEEKERIKREVIERERKPRSKRSRRDDRPTVVEWESMNRRVCGALVECVPVGLKDFVQECNYVADVIEEVRSRYIFTGDVAQLNHRERYAQLAFDSSKTPSPNLRS